MSCNTLPILIDRDFQPTILLVDEAGAPFPLPGTWELRFFDAGNSVPRIVANVANGKLASVSTGQIVVNVLAADAALLTEDYGSLEFIRTDTGADALLRVSARHLKPFDPLPEGIPTEIKITVNPQKVTLTATYLGGFALEIGTVTTLPSGSPATATITGPPGDQVLNLEIPTGPQGGPGAEGPPGPQDHAVLTDPAAGTAISTGQLVRFTRAHGQTISLRALTPFTMSSNWLTHVYGATTQMIVVEDPKPMFGDRVKPTGFSDPLCRVFYGQSGRAQTDFDNDKAFRAFFMPPKPTTGTPYFLDKVNGLDTNTGLSWAQAKKTWTSLRTVINAAAPTAAHVYVRGAAAAYGGIGASADGWTSNLGVAYDLAIIGVPDANGNKVKIGTLYGPTEATWTANATYPWVFQTPTTTMAQPGRVCDLSATETFIDGLGRVQSVPREYDAKTSLIDVATSPGSYWFDSANTTFYIHALSAQAPVLLTGVCIQRSIVDCLFITGHTGKKRLYLENVDVIGAVSSSSNIEFAGLNVRSLYSRANAFSIDMAEKYGLSKCVGFRPANDGYNIHNNGNNITGISQAAVAVVTCSSHNYATGEQVRIADGGTGGIGMNAALGVWTVTRINSTQFSIPLDSSALPAYTSNAKARVASTRGIDIDCSVVGSGTSEGSNQSISVHEDVEQVTVNNIAKEGWRNGITNIGTSKHWVINSRFEGTQTQAPSGPNPNQMISATDTATIALDDCLMGGYAETSAGSPYIQGNATNPIRVLNTELPRGANQWSNVSPSW